MCRRISRGIHTRYTVSCWTCSSRRAGAKPQKPFVREKVMAKPLPPVGNPPANHRKVERLKVISPEVKVNLTRGGQDPELVLAEAEVLAKYTRDELLDLAEEQGIEVPADVVKKAAVVAFLAGKLKVTVEQE
jgi:hypothetical protein